MLSKRKYIVARKNISGLIRVALADLEKCEKDERYRVDMNEWHEPNSHCTVCFAGSVIGQTLKTPIGRETFPHDFSSLIAAQLDALNSLREGDAGWAWDLDLELPQEAYPLKKYSYAVPLYEEDRAGFKRAMRRMADRFEKAGY